MITDGILRPQGRVRVSTRPAEFTERINVSVKLVEVKLEDRKEWVLSARCTIK